MHFTSFYHFGHLRAAAGVVIFDGISVFLSSIEVVPKKAVVVADTTTNQIIFYLVR